MTTRRSTYHLLAALLACLALASCANIGSPEGGPRDYTPPAVIATSPEYGAVNFHGNRVEIAFDELVNLKDQQKRVVVSPPTRTQPSVKTVGKKVVVEFRDDLEPNTTYTIDFSDAIEDNNEGNVLDGFSFTFSTGEALDTLAMSGIVLRASDLEPMQYIIVGAQRNLADSAFATVPFERVCRTDDRGRFTLRNLPAGNYHVFALNDVDGDYKMARSEDMAFVDEVYSPSVGYFTSTDTVFTFDHQVDTVYQATHPEYLPNNILLMMFNEHYTPLYLKKTERYDAKRLRVQFSAPSPELPELEILKPAIHADPWHVLERNESGDSLIYWLTDPALVKADSIQVAMRYLKAGDNDCLISTTDTINFNLRRSNAQIKEETQQRKERERLEKDLAKLTEKRDKALAEGKQPDEETLAQIELLTKQRDKVPHLDFVFEKKQVIEVTDSITLVFPEPLAHIDPYGVHLDKLLPDSTWLPVSPALLCPADSFTVLRYAIPLLLEPGESYCFSLDSLAVTGISGLQNNPFRQEFSVRSEDEYGLITLRLNVEDGAFVELLDNGGKPVRTATVEHRAARFEHVSPGSYFLRLTLDPNGNGKWDTGNYAQHLQPEEVYYYPKTLKLGRNSVRTLDWNIYAEALDLQKPDVLKRNKPENRRGPLSAPTDKDKQKTDDEEDDEFNSQQFGRNAYSTDKYQNYQNSRRREFR